jgi:hypothetical protein
MAMQIMKRQGQRHANTTMDISAIYFVAAIASSFVAATRFWGDCRNLTAPHLHRGRSRPLFGRPGD